MSLIDQLAESLGVASDEEPEPKIYGVVTGMVIDVADPLFLGRVRVQIDAIDGLDLSPWARIATPAASLASGIYWIPNPLDEVLVAFEQGNLNAPYVIGCVWAAVMPPPLPTPIPQIRMIRTPIGNQIAFSEVPPSINITSPALVGQVTVTDESVLLRCGGTSIAITPAGIVMVAPELSIVAAANTMTMLTGAVTITGTATLNLVAEASAINMTPASVTIASTAVTATAVASAVLSGGASTSVVSAGNVMVAAGAATEVAAGGSVLLFGGTPVMHGSPATGGVPKPVS